MKYSRQRCSSSESAIADNVRSAICQVNINTAVSCRESALFCFIVAIAIYLREENNTKYTPMPIERAMCVTLKKYAYG